MIHIAKPMLTDDEKNKVLEIMDTGIIACGSYVAEFEKKFASFNGTKYATATTSGTTAIEVALRACGISEGDKVITTPFSFIASTNPILFVGATPVFADVDEKTFNISPVSIRKILKEQKNIKALLIVHLYGQSCDMDEIMNIVEEYNLILIEDCCQSHGAEWKGKKVGLFGKAGCYSFYPTKNMTTGEGGIVVTDDDSVYENAKMLINHGMKVRYYHDMVGYNYRMTNIAAGIGLVQLDKLNNLNSIRQKNAEYYQQNIENSDIEKPYIDNNATHVFHQYTLKVKNGRRDEFVDYLNKNEIGSGIYYPLTIPEQKCYYEYDFEKKFSKSDKVKKEVVSIPVHPALTEKELKKIVEVINKF